jgi:hypothetical protein
MIQTRQPFYTSLVHLIPNIPVPLAAAGHRWPPPALTRLRHPFDCPFDRPSNSDKPLFSTLLWRCPVVSPSQKIPTKKTRRGCTGWIKLSGGKHDGDFSKQTRMTFPCETRL